MVQYLRGSVNAPAYKEASLRVNEQETGVNMKVRLLFFALLFGLFGCADSPERHLKRVHQQQLKHSTPSYAQGYKDGCSSAYYLVGYKTYTFQKNALRTQQDTLYSKGWREGHQRCLSEAKDKKISKERLHNRLYHGRAKWHEDVSDNDAYPRQGGYVPRTAEEQEIWESLKK
ncbi:MAG: hypothetical protein RLZ35_16 [Pseudomonadota bacterium]|jgi:hypothetical protein